MVYLIAFVLSLALSAMFTGVFYKLLQVFGWERLPPLWGASVFGLVFIITVVFLIRSGLRSFKEDNKETR